MEPLMIRRIACAASLLALAETTVAAKPTDTAATARAMEILGRAVAFKTVEGQGQVPAFATYLKSILTDAGFLAGDVTITPFKETATFVARWRGSGKKRPMLINAHMDVVAADPKDWARDPFSIVRKNGYLFGRGVLDNKFDLSMIMATIVNLKKSGFKPNRDIILVFSGDEETTQDSTQTLTRLFPDAEFLLNGDAGGGAIGEDGRNIAYAIQAAEKTYADFEISVTDPGGHSSRPTGSNAIYTLAQAIDHIASYEFPVQSSELTRAFFRESAKHTPGDLGAAMKAFSESPQDAPAIARLNREPKYIGQIRTTCVATMIKGGHATNALPQSANANINCRIFPGVTIEDVKATLQKVIANDKATLTLASPAFVSDASPLRADIMAALRKAVDSRAKNLAIVPEMEAGATDSLFFRNLGIPSYGVSGSFIKASDYFAHGLNERVPEASVAGALDHWRILITELAK
jgi:carboxypeptidase PM20D1